MRGKDNYTMIKMNTPKRVTLPNGRTFLVRYKRVSRAQLPANVTIGQDILKEPHLKTKDEKEVDKEIAESLILLKK